MPKPRIIVKIRNLQSPANLQPIRPTGQHRRIRRRDLAPISAISVVPLSQTPQIVARLHHVVMPVVIDSLCSWSSGRLRRELLGRLDDQWTRLLRSNLRDDQLFGIAICLYGLRHRKHRDHRDQQAGRESLWGLQSR